VMKIKVRDVDKEESNWGLENQRLEIVLFTCSRKGCKEHIFYFVLSPTK
jgi:hypothetical protein